MDPLQYTDGVLRAPGGAREPTWPRFALLGDPVGHTLSPLLHAAALRARGESGQYAAIRVSAGELSSCLRDAHGAEVEGLNLTLPHKHAALALATHLEPTARRLGACNTLMRQERGFAAHNTDAPGLAMALRRFAPAGALGAARQAVVVGSGGAARAAVAALAEVGVPRVRVLARHPEHAAWASALGCDVAALDPRALMDCGVLVQATPLGLSVDDPLPIELTSLPRAALVLDLTYGPHTSQLLQQAAARGCATSDGLPMLVAQAALAFALWRGGDPPLQVMARAVGIAWR